MIGLMWGCIIFISVFLGIVVILHDRNDRRPSLKKKGYGYGALYVGGGILCGRTLLIMIRFRFSAERIPMFLLLVSAYYCILLLLRPMLRKVANARTCGNLWCFPLISFILFVFAEVLDVGAYRVSIPLPFTIPQSLAPIWAIGCAACLLWHLARHLVFRRRLLKNAVRVMDGPLLEMWYRQQYICDVSKEYFPLYISSQLTTPVSVGVWHRTIFVALPDKVYSDEELKWIFRHELIHNGRRHGRTKLVMTIMASIFWFNPLVWVALRKGAEDMELSCDETVVLDYELKDRKAYASLLLRTAADYTGFNSSLNGSANSLQYRMKKILKPAEKWKTFTSAVVFSAVNFLAFVIVVFVSFVGPRDTLGNYLHEEFGSEPQMISAWVQWDNIIDKVPVSKDPKILQVLMDEPVSVMYQPYINAAKPPYAACSVMTKSGIKYITVMENLVKIESEIGTRGGTWYVLSEDFNFMEFASAIDPIA